MKKQTSILNWRLAATAATCVGAASTASLDLFDLPAEVDYHMKRYTLSLPIGY